MYKSSLSPLFLEMLDEVGGDMIKSAILR